VFVFVGQTLTAAAVSAPRALARRHALEPPGGPADARVAALRRQPSAPAELRSVHAAAAPATAAERWGES
jgi:hypothetical protein